jgi:hypothetical protein
VFERSIKKDAPGVRAEDQMTSPEPKLRAQVVGDAIIVTLPASNYSVTYYKPDNPLRLLVERIPDTDDLRIPMLGPVVVLNTLIAAY